MHETLDRSQDNYGNLGFKIPWGNLQILPMGTKAVRGMARWVDSHSELGAIMML